MSFECIKAIRRRLRDPAFEGEFFVGHGIDITAGSREQAAFDSLQLHARLFARIASCRLWSREDGDFQTLPGGERGRFDFVHSSHTLEHAADPFSALGCWFECLKPGGYLVITVPDEDLYEQGEFPSTFNHDHRWTFSIYKRVSWSPNSINVTNLIASLPAHRIKRLHLCDDGFDYELGRQDQTRGPADASIEFVVEKL